MEEELFVPGDEGYYLVLLLDALALSKQARRLVYQNLTFALAMIIVLVVSGLGFSLLLPVGVVGHKGNTVLVWPEMVYAC